MREPYVSDDEKLTRPWPWFWVDTLRGVVRLTFPVACLLIWGLLLFSAQGMDVLRVLVSAMAGDEGGDKSVSGLLFLLASSAMLSTSIWYASRWLLTAQMVGLPLPPTGFIQTWLPRAMGIAAPLLVAGALYGLIYKRGDLSALALGQAQLWAWGFVALAVALLGLYWVRGYLLVRLSPPHGAKGRHTKGSLSQPAHIEVSEETPQLTRFVMVWSVALSLALAALFILFPITLPRVVGAAAVAALALMSINLFGSFVLTYAPLRHAMPPLWLPLVLLAGVLIAQNNDNHVVQPAADITSEPVPEDALVALARGLPKDGITIFVASEGGGIRAAYWTAAVLDALPPEIIQRIRVLSGVSGGSLGVAAWLATNRQSYCPEMEGTKGNVVSANNVGPPVMATTQALSADFVAPAVAGMLYGDLIQRFIPWPIGRLDRSRAMEGAWIQAFAHLPNQPFAHTLDAFYAGACPDMPQLMLNSTRVETGDRVVLTRLRQNQMFLNTFDAMQLGSDAKMQSLAGLVHHSARFPAVSPAGTVRILSSDEDQPSSIRLVDGGYFDNSGVQSVLDLIHVLSKRPDFSKMRPLLLVVRNTIQPLDRPLSNNAPVSTLFPETGSIIGALAGVRGSHATTVRAEALRELGPDLVDALVPAEQDVAPLGWALSASSRKALTSGAKTIGKKVGEILTIRIRCLSETATISASKPQQAQISKECQV